MNPLYNMIMSNAMNRASAVSFQAMNPVQKLQYAYQAMQNPQAFVMQSFPDIPAEIQNNPNQILSYLQQTRNISQTQINQLMNQYPMR